MRPAVLQMIAIAIFSMLVGIVLGHQCSRSEPDYALAVAFASPFGLFAAVTTASSIRDAIPGTVRARLAVCAAAVAALAGAIGFAIGLHLIVFMLVLLFSLPGGFAPQ